MTDPDTNHSDASQPEEKPWITALKKELMFSKMTHVFRFSRDEVVELLGGYDAISGVLQK